MVVVSTLQATHRPVMTEPTPLPLRPLNVTMTINQSIEEPMTMGLTLMTISLILMTINLPIMTIFLALMTIDPNMTTMTGTGQVVPNTVKPIYDTREMLKLLRKLVIDFFIHRNFQLPPL